MARITASLYTSHIPAVGAAFDLGKTKEDYWKPVFAGYDFDKQWMKAHKPDALRLRRLCRPGRGLRAPLLTRERRLASAPGIRARVEVA
jgi:hypothetical protein